MFWQNTVSCVSPSIPNSQTIFWYTPNKRALILILHSYPSDDPAYLGSSSLFFTVQCLSNSPLCVLRQDRVEPLQVVRGIKDHLLTVLNGKVDCIHNLISKMSPVKNLERNKQSEVFTLQKYYTEMIIKLKRKWISVDQLPLLYELHPDCFDF